MPFGVLRFDAASGAYAEKNWGGGFPDRWWWGQAHDFGDDVSVAFACGPVGEVYTDANLRLTYGGRVPFLERGQPEPAGPPGSPVAVL